VITVALDRNPEAARAWIEAAKPTHPSLVDARHRVADLYNMVNVPTALWIDGEGRIARPNDVAFATDTYRHLTGLDSARHLAALRRWVAGESDPAPDEIRARLRLPTEADQRARAEFALGRWLFERGRPTAAAAHFARAGALAPHDFMIRRGSMPMQDLDPMGPVFRAMVAEWTGAGNAYYHPLPDSAPTEPGPLTAAAPRR
jgi:hypothetical protein